MNEDRKKFEELAEKIKKMKASGEVDLSSEEDLSLAVMNLVSLEEHFFMTGEKTQKPEYFDILAEVRELRKKLLGRLIDRSKHEGETWCITKHLLATTMRLMEVGTKAQGDGKKEEAKELFDQAYKMYSIFWGLRLNLLKLPDIKQMAKEEEALRQAQGKPWTLQEVVDKLVDCCDE
ncbi:MAG: hypothetical protein AAB686_01400 [Patescibacteria group bacterium]